MMNIDKRKLRKLIREVISESAHTEPEVTYTDYGGSGAMRYGNLRMSNRAADPQYDERPLQGRDLSLRERRASYTGKHITAVLNSLSLDPTSKVLRSSVLDLLRSQNSFVIQTNNLENPDRNVLYFASELLFLDGEAYPYFDNVRIESAFNLKDNGTIEQLQNNELIGTVLAYMDLTDAESLQFGSSDMFQGEV